MTLIGNIIINLTIHYQLLYGNILINNINTNIIRLITHDHYFTTLTSLTALKVPKLINFCGVIKLG